MLKVGGNRDYDLDLIEGTIKTGERGIILRFVRGEEKFLCFLGIDEACALTGALAKMWQEIDRYAEVVEREAV